MGCESDFEVDGKGIEKIVLLSNITPDSTFRVHLSSSTFISDTNLPSPPTDAHIEIFENDASLGIFNLDRSNTYDSPQFVLNKKPCRGCEYKVIANSSDLSQVESTTTIPSEIQDLEVKIVNHDKNVIKDGYGNNFESHDYIVTINSADFDPDAHYHLIIWKEDKPYDVINGDTMIYSSAREEIFYFIQNENLQFIELFHEFGTLIDGKDLVNQNGITLWFGFSAFQNSSLNTPINIELRKTNTDYFRFHKSVAEQERSEFSSTAILADEAIPIYNNIQNGLGNFSAYLSSIEEIEWYRD